MHFGDWLSAKRGKRGEPGFVSQRELARRMGVDPTYISQLERRETAPSFDTRHRIHKALGTSEDELKTIGILPDGQADWELTIGAPPASHPTPAMITQPAKRETLEAFYELGPQITEDDAQSLLLLARHMAHRLRENRMIGIAAHGFARNSAADDRTEDDKQLPEEVGHRGVIGFDVRARAV